MLEVDGYARCGPQTEFYSAMGIPEATLHIPGLSRSTVEKRRQEPLNECVQWGPQSLSNVSTSSGKSDDEDADDEYRGFTPPPPRERLSYTRYQLELLNGIYIKVRYPNKIQKQLIAKRVGITREQVKIWFQNRRRKDVVGSSKSKEPSESSGSNSDSEKSRDSNPDGEKSPNEQQEQEGSSERVPSVVLKSIIAELEKFENDYLRAQQTKKKRRQRSRVVPKKVLNEKLVLESGLDMISPPNQVTPSAIQHRPYLNNFNHSHKTSAFESPRDLSRQTCHRIPFPNENVDHEDTGVVSQPAAHKDNLPTTSGQSLHCESLPVLSDLLGYRTTMEAREREHFIRNTANSAALFQRMQYQQLSGLSNSNANFGLNRIFPFPLVAEPPALLSSLRQTEPHRAHAPYRATETKDATSLYQPLVISSLPNPFYSSQTWTGQPYSEPVTYNQL